MRNGGYRSIEEGWEEGRVRNRMRFIRSVWYKGMSYVEDIIIFRFVFIVSWYLVDFLVKELFEFFF